MTRKLTVIALTIAITLLSAFLLNMYPAQVTGLSPLLPATPAPKESDEGKLRLAFSMPGHFYEDSIEVSVTASNSDAEIYYTTDGSEPTSTADKYIEPLSFTADRNVNVVTLKAIAVYGDTTTRTLAHTYFLGSDVQTRFDTIVFSVSTDPDYLYDYDTGIFVEGRLRDEYEATHPNEHIQPPAPANFNWRGMEGERPIYVEAFTPDGTRVVAQAAGIRVSGGWSRANDQKSLRLIARREYEPDEGKFHYDFFQGERMNGTYGAPITEYDSIVLRDGANDREFAMLRNEAASLLARDAGFREVSPARAAAVFVNGEYYGFAWLQVSLNEQYLQDVYGAPDKSFEIVGDSERGMNTDNMEAIAALVNVNSYADKNLRDNAVFAELEALVDIDNFLRYYAFEIYFGNDDWPHNNLKRWRYTGEQTEGLAPQLDGRWRYLMYDLDWTLGLYDEPYTVPTLGNVLGGGERYSPLLSAILKRPDMAEKFGMILCDLASNIATEQKVDAAVNTLYTEAQHEIAVALVSRKYSFWVSTSTIIQNHINMNKFARNRGEFMLEAYRRYIGYEPEMFQINISGGEAVIGTAKGTSARYFLPLSIPVSPVLPKFYVFDHWVVNGETIYEPNLVISADDCVSGEVNLELVTHYQPPALVFDRAYASSQGNGCVLRNITDKSSRTDGLYISDSADNPLRWALPSASVAPDGTLVMAGKGSSDANDLLNIQMGFNVKKNRVLYLSDENGVILDYIDVE